MAGKASPQSQAAPASDNSLEGQLTSPGDEELRDLETGEATDRGALGGPTATDVDTAVEAPDEL